MKKKLSHVKTWYIYLEQNETDRCTLVFGGLVKKQPKQEAYFVL